jgi:hypothetical protein
MRQIVAWVLGWKVVYLMDHDGHVCQRLAEPTPFGLVAWRMSRLFRIARVLLLPDGTVTGRSYVTRWKPLNGGMKHG